MGGKALVLFVPRPRHHGQALLPASHFGSQDHNHLSTCGPGLLHGRQGSGTFCTTPPTSRASTAACIALWIPRS